MLDLIEQYTLSVGETHRKKLGQFFTESRVAKFMVNWATQEDKTPLHDPAFGLGAFYFAAKELGFNHPVSGNEVDRKILSFFQRTENSSHYTIDNIDYLSCWNMRHPAIVCNPPYMRFQKFDGREQIFHEFSRQLGVKPSGYTNIASTFLIKSIFELQAGGRLAYLMPLEFLNAGYGKLVKQLLLEQGTLHAVIQIDCEKDVFPDATTSVGIILFEKQKRSIPIRFYAVHDIDHLDTLLEDAPISAIAHDALSCDDKWLRYFDRTSQVLNTGQLVPITTYGAFTRGIATGANEFFTLTSAQMDALALTADEIVPCITKSAQIKSPIFRDHDLQTLQGKDAPVFLLNAHGTLSNQAKNYIAHGESQGFHQRYLTKLRKPWYKLEKRTPSPLLFGVFSRNGFKVIRNFTHALNLTCYHGFNPNIFGAAHIDALFLYFLSTAGQNILSQNKRRYGDALDKFEPNDLNVALCPSMEWFAQLPRAEIAMEMLHVERFGKLSAIGESMFAELTDVCAGNAPAKEFVKPRNFREGNSLRCAI